mmetsp:Transcript_1709/g.2252  ORF Transcript_1709/g.2252 Transcript_1709/m.2252 type:complete len:145 (-) Transcript_1709:39-473(-)
MNYSTLITISCIIMSANAFTPSRQCQNIGRVSLTTQLNEKKGNIFSNFFDELDAFVDDATNRRLGNGAAFYGKRKSTFYGEEDFNRKLDKDVDDATEDYQGPKTAGYFQWMADEDGQMRPVTRMKKQNIERNPNFWDKTFKNDE